jgi:glycerate kinase
VRALLCPTSLKGVLSARAAAAALARGFGTANLTELPVADGGEGTAEALLAALGGEWRDAGVSDPLGRPHAARWLALPDGRAVVEAAAAIGLPLVAPGERDPLRASSRGLGELVLAALERDPPALVIGLGGTATVDGGAGLRDVVRRLDVPSVALTDVRTPLRDAARVYGPQKGASGAEVELLTRRLARLAEQFASRTGVDVRELEGGGAAGGLAGGLAAIGARLEPGFDVVANAAGLDAALEDADLVLTGEGKVDATSFAGKVVGGVLEWAADVGVPHRGVIAGQITAEAREELSVLGAWGEALVDRVWQAGEAFTRTALLVEEAALDLARRALAKEHFWRQ